MSVLLKRKSDGTVEGEANEGCRSPDGFEGTARPAARQSARQGCKWPGAELNRRHADFQSHSTISPAVPVSPTRTTQGSRFRAPFPTNPQRAARDLSTSDSTMTARSHR